MKRTKLSGTQTIPGNSQVKQLNIVATLAISLAGSSFAPLLQRVIADMVATSLNHRIRASEKHRIGLDPSADDGAFAYGIRQRRENTNIYRRLLWFADTSFPGASKMGTLALLQLAGGVS